VELSIERRAVCKVPKAESIDRSALTWWSSAAFCVSISVFGSDAISTDRWTTD
jgi:hypothetical protein